MRDVGTGYVTCGAREDRRLPVVDGDENVPMCRNGRLFMSGTKINAPVPARCGNRRLSRPIRRNGRLILLWWARGRPRGCERKRSVTVSHETIAIAGIVPPWPRGSFYQAFPCRLQKRYFPLPPGFIRPALLWLSPFYCNTAHRPFNYLCGTIVAWSIEIGGGRSLVKSLGKRPFSRYLTELRNHTPSQFWV